MGRQGFTPCRCARESALATHRNCVADGTHIGTPTLLATLVGRTQPGHACRVEKGPPALVRCEPPCGPCGCPARDCGQCLGQWAWGAPAAAQRAVMRFASRSASAGTSESGENRLNSGQCGPARSRNAKSRPERRTS